jgi:hypothetical protein
MKSRSQEFEQRIARLLTQANVSFKSNVAVEGLEADFVVSDPSGTIVILEAKSWEPNEINLKRAANQAALLKMVTKADKAYFVIDGLDQGDAEAGVIAFSQLLEVLPSLSISTEVRTRSRGFRSFQESEKIVFAAMPFSPEYDDIFFVAMSYAAQSVGAVCRRVDLEEFGGDVVVEIKRLIDSSIAVIADLSESKPNVLYEVGYAHALDRPTVHICSTALDELPFDVRNWNTLQYKRGQTYEFQERLSARLKVLLDHKRQF